MTDYQYLHPFRGALGHTQDPELLKRTFQTILTGSRDQDTIYFFRGLTSNVKARRAVAEFFKAEYETVCGSFRVIPLAKRIPQFYKRYEKTFSLRSFVSMSFSYLSTQKDYEETEAFFKVSLPRATLNVS